jgi:drug/metabolite transporter (DMT)-like permease
LHVVTAFALVYVLWGSTYLAIRLAVDHLTPLLMGGLRFTTAGVLMLGYRAARGHRITVPRRDLIRLAIIGTLLLVTANVVLGWAETYIPTGLAALFIAVTPLWFLILERMSHSTDRLSRRGLAGIELGVLGVAILLCLTSPVTPTSASVNSSAPCLYCFQASVGRPDRFLRSAGIWRLIRTRRVGGRC